MVDSYFKNQNRCLFIMVIMLFALIVGGTTFIVYIDHIDLAVIFASTQLSILISLIGIIRSNLNYMKDTEQTSELKRATLREKGSVTVVNQKDSNLNFKFNRD